MPFAVVPISVKEIIALKIHISRFEDVVLQEIADGEIGISGTVVRERSGGQWGGVVVGDLRVLVPQSRHVAHGFRVGRDGENEREFSLLVDGRLDFEIALNTLNIQRKNFEWASSLGFSINKNKINHIYYNYDEDGVEQDDTTNGWFIGQPADVIWYYETDGVWQNTPEDIKQAALVGQKPGDPKVINHYTEDDQILPDGTRVPVYNDNDKVYQGPQTPPIYWNFRNDFTLWKDLTLSISFYSYMGHKSRAGYWLNQENGGSQVTNGFNVAAREYWTPDNPTNDYCRLNAAGPNTGLAGGVDKVYNRSFVRLDDITIGYTIPQKWTKKFMVDRIRLTASCKNVCTFDSWEYGDPETGGLANRTFNFGINVTL